MRNRRHWKERCNLRNVTWIGETDKMFYEKSWAWFCVSNCWFWIETGLLIQEETASCKLKWLLHVQAHPWLTPPTHPLLQMGSGCHGDKKRMGWCIHTLKDENTIAIFIIYSVRCYFVSIWILLFLFYSFFSDFSLLALGF